MYTHRARSLRRIVLSLCCLGTGLLSFSRAHAGNENANHQSADNSAEEIEMNGRELNGTLVEDIPPEPAGRFAKYTLPSRLKVVRLQDGVKLKGATDLASDVKIVDSTLRRSGGGATDFVGALLSGESLRGKPVLLRIDKITSASVENSKNAKTERKTLIGVGETSGVLLKLPRFVLNRDVQLYRIFATAKDTKLGMKQSFKTGGRPLCSGDNLAIAVPGAWNYRTGSRENPVDPTLVTFACLDAAIAKCIEPVGYRPWAMHPPPTGDGSGSDQAPVSLAPYHAACVRAMRADYCGTGFSLTRNGTHINIYDTIGIQARLSELPSIDRVFDVPVLQGTKKRGPRVTMNLDAYQFEAKWSPEGATCIDETRKESVPVSSALPFPNAPVVGFTTSGATVRAPVTPVMNVMTYIEEHCELRLDDGQPRLCRRSAGSAAPGTIFTEFETKN